MALSPPVVAHHQFPLYTRDVLSLTPAVDLSLHNYTLFPDVIAFPLIPMLGVVATFNVVYLGLQTLTAWTMFRLARAVIGRDSEAWLAGVLFGFSPTLIARSEAHLSLVAAAPLPVFVLLLTRLDREPSLRTALGLGATVAWATFCDPYYGVFCILIGLCYLFARHVSVRAFAYPAPPTYVRAADIVALLASVAIVFILGTGGTEVRLMNVTVAMRSLYTPVLILTIAVTCRLVLIWRPVLVLKDPPPLDTVWRLSLAAGSSCLALVSPLLLPLCSRFADGGELHATPLWRSSAAGVDLAAMFAPNPNHHFIGGPWRTWLESRPDGYVDNVASLTFVGLLIVAAAVCDTAFDRRQSGSRSRRSLDQSRWDRSYTSRDSTRSSRLPGRF